MENKNKNEVAVVEKKKFWTDERKATAKQFGIGFGLAVITGVGTVLGKEIATSFINKTKKVR